MQPLDEEIAKTRDLVDTLHFESFPKLTDNKFRLVLNRKVNEWEIATRDHLDKSNPFKEHYSRLSTAEKDFSIYGGSEESILNDLNNYKSLHQSADVSFWEQKTLSAKSKLAEKRKKRSKTNRSIAESLTAIRRNEQEAWEKEYENQLLQWQISETQRLRAKFLKEMKVWFETIDQMKETFEELDVDPDLLWGLSGEKLTQLDIYFLKKWAEYLKKAKNLNELCDLMGRMRKAKKSERTEVIETTIQHIVRTPDLNSNVVVGIELGRDLESVIPQELALLSDPDVSLLFDLKYVEKRLMCFSRQGYKNEFFEETFRETVTVVDEENMGPIIVCIDTSDSMAGRAEYIAKALTLNLVSRAVSQKRKCYLINFSTSITTLDLTPPAGIRDLLDFLKMSFHGGTDIVPALYEGLRMMHDENYEKADMMVISDFVFSRLPPDIVTLCKDQKEKDNRFFALSISPFDTNRIDKDIFDQSWKYHSRTGNLRDVTGCIDFV